jgi:Uma2 family endonuclease
MSTKTLITAEEFARLPTGETEDYELVDGKLLPLPSTKPAQAEIRGNLEYLLRGYFGVNPIGRVLGEVDCRITDHLVRRPDLAIFLIERPKGIDRTKIPIRGGDFLETPLLPGFTAPVAGLLAGF